MRPGFALLAAAILFAGGLALPAKMLPEQVSQLPPPASRPVNFSADIKPILESSCIKCHGRGRDKGGFALDTRETLLKGGDSGPAVVTGKSAESSLIELVQGFDPDAAMPKKGKKLTAEQIGLLRAWIDQGLPWDAGITFGRQEPANLKPRRPQIPGGPGEANPIDAFLRPYFAEHQIPPASVVDDRLYARRVWLDILGLIPPPEELAKFAADKHPDKRARLVRALLADNANYAQNWMTFWNDALRNDYSGTGYIDGGRKQITGWLYAALATNMHYDQFVAELIHPNAASEGFAKGIVWRGSVNASQTPQMQAAQNVSQVFMGVNLKCASCHDSFVNDLTLSDAYGLAGVFADAPLEMVHCDKPTGKVAELKFLYPELGPLGAPADKDARLRRLAEIVTGPQDGRLTRTLANRLWQKFLGRGLVEPVDEMEKTAWNPDLLDWLAEDFAAHHYDVKHLIEEITTSRAYQMPAIGFNEKDAGDYVFRGPMVRRMSAEEFRDALGEVTGVWYEAPAGEIDPTLGNTNVAAATAVKSNWIWNDTNAAAAVKPGPVYFRKNFKLAEIPGHATVLATADNSFTLYVNGKKAGAGDDFGKFVVKDIHKYLIKGNNSIAVEAVNGGEQPNPAGLFAYVVLRDSGQEQHAAVADFATDHTWVCSAAKEDGWEKRRYAASGWKASAELGPVGMGPWNLADQFKSRLAFQLYTSPVRAVLANADPLQVALGRPNREQVVTTRIPTATTLQALALTNGKDLAELLQTGASNLLAEPPAGRDLVTGLYDRALGRRPTEAERKLAGEIVGHPAQPAGVEDLLWGLAMLPEFQLIY